MPIRQTSDPVSLIIKDCHRSEDDAKRIYHQLVEEQQRDFRLDGGATIHLSEEQIGEFVKRYSAEVEPTYWESKRLKH